jgi:hypothetical protein
MLLGLGALYIVGPEAAMHREAVTFSWQSVALRRGLTMRNEAELIGPGHPLGRFGV